MAKREKGRKKNFIRHLFPFFFINEKKKYFISILLLALSLNSLTFPCQQSKAKQPYADRSLRGNFKLREGGYQR